MNIPKYWAKQIQQANDDRGRRFLFKCWQWSNLSQDDAAERAKIRARELLIKTQSGQLLDRYSYGERAMREEIKEGISDGDGGEIGIITRNSYGCLVLNAARAMFVDVDFEDRTTQSSGGVLNRLFGGKRRESPEETGLRSVEEWAVRNPDFSLRVYRTFAGLRCLVTNDTFDPTSAESIGVMKALKADPLYINLCRNQQCFRARLTPKPWRIGASHPPTSYPWDDPTQETKYREWEEEYELWAANFTACKLIGRFGKDDVHPDLAQLLTVHDNLACRDPNLPLA
ncbi:MAG TPA: hypothetical protein VI756_19710 [Blastocatellia bacterium]